MGWGVALSYEGEREEGKMYGGKDRGSSGSTCAGSLKSMNFMQLYIDNV